MGRSQGAVRYVGADGALEPLLTLDPAKLTVRALALYADLVLPTLMHSAHPSRMDSPNWISDGSGQAANATKLSQLGITDAEPCTARTTVSCG
jgi:hypothetical protein